MPKGKGKKSSNTVNKRSNTAPRKGMQGMRKNTGGGFSSAPAAMSDFLKQHIKFGGSGDTLNISGLIAVANIGHTATAGTFVGFVDGLGQAGGAIRLSPTNPATLNSGGAAAVGGFVSQALDLLGSAFTRYKAKKLKFHYRPQSGTNSTQQLVFAFAADPVHPLIGAASTVVTAQGLESLADSIPFAPWAPWDMDVSSKLDPVPWLYTDSNSIADGATPSETSRFDSFGSIGCFAATASTTTAANYGVLYMSFDMDFKEFCPISVTRPSLMRLRDKIKAHMTRDPMTVKSVSSFSSPTFHSETKVLDLAELVNTVQELRKRSDVTMHDAVRLVIKDRTLTAEACKLVHESGLSDLLYASEGADHEKPCMIGFTRIAKPSGQDYKDLKG
jgi:hypothetical protein